MAITEPNRLNDVLKWEEEVNYSREKVTVLSGESLVMGEVVGKVTASDKMVAIEFAAEDGSEDAYGIMIADVDASAADVEGVAIVRDAIIIADNLTWPAGATAGNKAAALAQLRAAGIVSDRTEV